MSSYLGAKTHIIIVSIISLLLFSCCAWAAWMTPDCRWGRHKCIVSVFKKNDNKCCTQTVSRTSGTKPFSGSLNCSVTREHSCSQAAPAISHGSPRKRAKWLQVICANISQAGQLFAFGSWWFCQCSGVLMQLKCLGGCTQRANRHWDEPCWFAPESLAFADIFFPVLSHQFRCRQVSRSPRRSTLVCSITVKPGALSSL